MPLVLVYTASFKKEEPSTEGILGSFQGLEGTTKSTQNE